MRIVIIGCGLIARSHAEAIQQIPGAVLVGASDKSFEAAQKISERYACAAYEDTEAMLEELKPDVAIICVPTFVHKQYVSLCARHKVDVLCEKPLERNAAVCKDLIDEVRQAGIIFMTAQVVRCWPGYVDIKRMIESGELGRIYMIHLRRVSSRAGAYGKWLFDPELGGGAMHDMLVHDIDFLRYVAGPFEKCFANAVTDETGCYNNVMANIICRNGIHALAETSFTMQTGYPFSFSVNIVAAEATLEYAYRAGATIADRSGSESRLTIWRKDKGAELVEVKEYDAYLRQLEYFLTCVAERRQPDMITLDESFEVINMIDALHRSADRGEIVYV